MTDDGVRLTSVPHPQPNFLRRLWSKFFLRSRLSPDSIEEIEIEMTDSERRCNVLNQGSLEQALRLLSERPVEAKSVHVPVSWDVWLQHQPANIQKMAEKIQPGHIYRLKETGQIVVWESFCEDGTVTVTVIGKHDNPAGSVFGIAPEGLQRIEFDDLVKLPGYEYLNEKVEG